MLALLMLALEYRQCLCLALVINSPLFFYYSLDKYLTASILEDHSSTTIDFCFCLASSSNTVD